TGTLGDFSVNYERDLTSKDRLRFIVRHEFSRYDIPNEHLQQAVGQRQTVDHGRNEWKVGVESDNIFLNEQFSYVITDPTQFATGTPPTFGFQGNRPD